MFEKNKNSYSLPFFFFFFFCIPLNDILWCACRNISRLFWTFNLNNIVQISLHCGCIYCAWGSLVHCTKHKSHAKVLLEMMQSNKTIKVQAHCSKKWQQLKWVKLWCFSFHTWRRTIQSTSFHTCPHSQHEMNEVIFFLFFFLHFHVSGHHPFSFLYKSVNNALLPSTSWKAHNCSPSILT